MGDWSRPAGPGKLPVKAPWHTRLKGQSSTQKHRPGAPDPTFQQGIEEITLEDDGDEVELGRRFPGEQNGENPPGVRQLAGQGHRVKLQFRSGRPGTRG